MELAFDLEELEESESSKEDEERVEIPREGKVKGKADQYDELKGSCNFSPADRTTLVRFPISREAEDDAEDAEKKIAREHCRCLPNLELAFHEKDAEPEDDEKFIHGRIENRSKLACRTAASCEVTVDAVSNHGEQNGGNPPGGTVDEKQKREWCAQK